MPLRTTSCALVAIAFLALSVKGADRADDALASCKEKLGNKEDHPNVIWVSDIKAAIADCTRALHANPSSAEAYYERGRAYVDYGKNSREKATSNAAALNDYNKAISLNASYAEAYLARGYLRRTQMKDPDGALQDLTHGLDLAGTGWPGFWATKSKVLESRAALRKEKGDIDGAISDLGAAIAAYRGKDVYLLCEKRSALKKAKGDLDGAISDLTYARTTFSNPPDRYYFRDLADLKRMKGDFDGAIGDLTHAIRLGSDSQDYLRRGEVRRAKGALYGAIADFTSALLVDPCFADAWSSRASAREARGDAAGAQADAAQAKQITGGETSPFIGIHGRCGRAFTFEAAVMSPAPGEDTLIALPNGTIAPQNSPAAQTFLRSKEEEFISAAYSDADKKDYRSAVYDYTKAIKVGFKDPSLYSRRGALRQAMGDVDGGIGDLSEAVRLLETALLEEAHGRLIHTWTLGKIPITTAELTATMYDMRGQAKAKADDFDGAIEDFTKAIQLEPSKRSYSEHRSDALRSRLALACDRGDAASCNTLGIHRENGEAGLPRDLARAVELYKKACDGGNAAGCTNLGREYAAAEGGLSKNLSQAVALYRKACDGGYAPGCYNLGNEYARGEGGLPKDLVQAVALITKACDGGFARGCSGLGVAYANGEGGLPKDLVQAVALYRKACAGGDLQGCGNLGYEYARGEGGLPKDLVQAVALYRKACAGGDLQGCSNLGYEYARGEGGLPKDLVQAVALLTKACDGGFARGCSALGVAYANGQAGLPKDLVQAVALLTKACDGGYAPDCRRLGTAYANGDGLAKDPAQAAAFFKKACDRGDTVSCSDLGVR